MTFDDFLPNVLPSVAGCPDVVAKDHIIKAARLFCGRTLVWNYETRPTLTVAGKSTYALKIEDGQERVKLLTAWVDGAEVTIADAAAGRTIARRGTYCPMVFLENSAEIVVYPTPTVAALQVIVQLAVKPAMAAVEWPDELAEHVTDIAHGALATLCTLPRQEWTNPQLAGAEQALFMQRIAAVGFNVSRGFNITPKRARVNFF